MKHAEIRFHTPTAAEAALPYHVVAAGQTLALAAAAPVMRRYNQHVLILTLAGSGTIEVQGRRRNAMPGTLTWLDTARDYAHGCEPASPGWQYLWIGIHGFGLDRLFAQAGLAAEPVTRLADPGGARRQIEAILRQMAERGPHQAIRTSAAVAALLASLIADRRPLAGDGPREAPLDRALAALRPALARRWSMTDLAAAAGVSQSQLHRAFRAGTGLTPGAWLRRERINAAKPLLMDRGLSVQAVAEAIGYPDPFHFSRDFRALVGRSPRVFRNDGGA